MRRRIVSWRGRNAAQAAPAVAVADRPDCDAVAHIGAALRKSYEEEEDDDSLDDRLVALMLELSLEPPDVERPRRKRRR